MARTQPSPLVRDLQAALGIEAVLFEPEDLLPYELSPKNTTFLLYLEDQVRASLVGLLRSWVDYL